MGKMRKIIAFLLALAMALTLCACAKPTPIAAGKNTVGVKDGETLGQGATAFTVEVTDGQGTKTDFTVKTDEKTVGAALQALNIISGEESDYGLYIKEVIGITADYDRCSKRRSIWLCRGKSRGIGKIRIKKRPGGPFFYQEKRRENS